MSEKKHNPLRLIVNSSIIIFALILLTYVGIKLGAIYDKDEYRKTLFLQISSKIELLCFLIWEFLRPFLQLIIILLIAEWILGKFGISISPKQSKIEWNIQTIIAIIIISAFALAALSGVSGVDYLKDVALVVVGFYFGSQKEKKEQTNNLPKEDLNND